MGIRRLALGAMVSSLSMLTACGGQEPAGAGRVSIVLSSMDATSVVPQAAAALDSPATSAAPEHGCAALQAADVTFSSILARTLDGKLTDVTMDLPVTVDLLALVSGKEATLPAGSLPPGTYDQLVVVMTRLEVTLSNGTKIAITPPGGGWTAIVPVSPPVTVVTGETTTVPLSFRRDRSFGCDLGRWDFHPEFECGHRGHR